MGRPLSRVMLVVLVGSTGGVATSLAACNSEAPPPTAPDEVAELGRPSATMQDTYIEPGRVDVACDAKDDCVTKCDRGDAESCVELYVLSQGVPKSDAHLLRGCSLGSQRACIMLEMAENKGKPASEE